MEIQNGEWKRGKKKNKVAFIRSRKKRGKRKKKRLKWSKGVKKTRKNWKKKTGKIKKGAENLENLIIENYNLVPKFSVLNCQYSKFQC